MLYIYFCASESLQFYNKSSSWSTDTLQWAEKIVSRAIPTEAVACRACEKFIKRHVGETNVTPLCIYGYQNKVRWSTTA